jgi:hypothetical protein
MADEDTTSVSVEEHQVKEELLVQKVVLESLDDADYDGVEEMRQDAREEISRLKKLLHDLRQKKQSTICMYHSQAYVGRHLFLVI